jgi:hypothetical protein
MGDKGVSAMALTSVLAHMALKREIEQAYY